MPALPTAPPSARATAAYTPSATRSSWKCRDWKSLAPVEDMPPFLPLSTLPAPSPPACVPLFYTATSLYPSAPTAAILVALDTTKGARDARWWTPAAALPRARLPAGAGGLCQRRRSRRRPHYAARDRRPPSTALSRRASAGSTLWPVCGPDAGSLHARWRHGHASWCRIDSRRRLDGWR